MKLLIEQSLDCKETEIRITCALMDERLKHLIEHIRLYTFSIPAQKDGVARPVALEEIYYFESVDSKTFLYLADEVYRCDQKLYELEQLLDGTTFLRVSKSCILNTLFVAQVRAQLSGRLEAELKNGEKVLISKHYTQQFRDKIMQGGC